MFLHIFSPASLYLITADAQTLETPCNIPSTHGYSKELHRRLFILIPSITKPCHMCADTGVLYLGFQLLLYVFVIHVLKDLLPE